MPTLEDWEILQGAPAQGKTETRILGTLELEKGGEQTAVIITEPIETPRAGILYGNVVQDNIGNCYFLRGDSTRYQDPTKVLSQAPPGMPTLTDVQLHQKDADHHVVSGRVYNDTYDGKPDGSVCGFQVKHKFIKGFKPGHIVKDHRGYDYYIENDQYLWPPLLEYRSTTVFYPNL